MIFFNNLSSNYNFYIKNDSASAIEILWVKHLFTQGYIQALIDATLESLTFITIGIFLIIYSPQVTIPLLIFLLECFFY